VHIGFSLWADREGVTLIILTNKSIFSSAAIAVEPLIGTPHL
jgi:hypothetical protein